MNRSTTSKFTLITSNANKISEYQSIGLPIHIEPGQDLPEIDTQDFNLIAAYKSKMAGDFNIVEDTILIIDDTVFHDIKFRSKDIINNINQYLGKSITWVVTLATSFNGEVHLFQSQVSGIIKEAYIGHTAGFGFDSYLHVAVDDTYKSLHQLKEEGRKNHYSPRMKALTKFHHFLLLQQNSDFRYSLDNLLEWTGAYQS